MHNERMNRHLHSTLDWDRDAGAYLREIDRFAALAFHRHVGSIFSMLIYSNPLMEMFQKIVFVNPMQIDDEIIARSSQRMSHSEEKKQIRKLTNIMHAREMLRIG